MFYSLDYKNKVYNINARNTTESEHEREREMEGGREGDRLCLAGNSVANGRQQVSSVK